MAASDTQINQIYLVDPKNSKTSLLLYEEQLGSNHLFLVAELTDIQKKTEKEEMRKIADIILDNFKAIKKSATEAMFESVLSQINQDLASLAVGGRKQWLGKFSAIIAVKTGENIFLANTGQTSCYIKRKTELLEILPAEKRGLHPLKTFSNFTSGKLRLKDQVVLTTASMLNFVALRHLGQVLSGSPQEQAVSELLGILKDSVNDQNSFCAFIFTYGDQVAAPQSADKGPIYAPMAEAEETIYAPAVQSPAVGEKLKNFFASFKVPSIPKISLPLPKFEKFERLSTARKFFLLSFALFLLIFAINIGAFFTRNHAKKAEAKIRETSDMLITQMNEAESAFIYQNDESAFKVLGSSWQTFEELKKLSSEKASQIEPVLVELDNKISRKATVENPAILTELKAGLTDLARAGNGFVLSGRQTNSIFTLYDSVLKNIFVLNKIDSDITGIAHLPGLGNLVATKQKIYRINETDKQLDAVITAPASDILRMEILPSRVYALDKAGRQVLRFNLSNGSFSAGSSILRSSIETENIQDLGLDADVYLLYSGSMKKYSSGNDTGFKLVDLSDPLIGATKLFVGNSLYVLEPDKKRVILYTKLGKLQNQIYFPNAENLTDFYVDEAARNIYLIDGTKLLKITF